MLASENSLLHGAAVAVGVSNFRLAFLNDVFVIFIAWINRTKIPSNFWHIRDLVSQLPIIASLFFGRLFQFSSKRQAICDLGVLSFEFLSVSPPDHMYPFGGVSFNSVNLVKPVRQSDRLLFSVDIPIGMSIRFPCATSRSV